LVAVVAFDAFLTGALGFAAAVLALEVVPPVTLVLAGARFAIVAGFFATLLVEVDFVGTGFEATFFEAVDDFVGAFFAASALVAGVAEVFDFVAAGFALELAAEVDFVVDLAFGFAATFVEGFAAGFAAGFVAGLFSLAAVDSDFFGASLTLPERPLGSAKTPFSAPCEMALLS